MPNLVTAKVTFFMDLQEQPYSFRTGTIEVDQAVGAKKLCSMIRALIRNGETEAFDFESSGAGIDFAIYAFVEVRQQKLLVDCKADEVAKVLVTKIDNSSFDYHGKYRIQGLGDVISVFADIPPLGEYKGLVFFESAEVFISDEDQNLYTGFLDISYNGSRFELGADLIDSIIHENDNLELIK